MLRFALVFLIVTLLAAFFGFAGVENYSFEGAKIIFGVFLVLTLLSVLGSVMARRST